MLVQTFLLAVVSTCALCAPLLEEEKPLVRVKRSVESVANFDDPPMNDLAKAVVDKKATVNTETTEAENKSHDSPDLLDQGQLPKVATLEKEEAKAADEDKVEQDKSGAPSEGIEANLEQLLQQEEMPSDQALEEMIQQLPTEDNESSGEDDNAIPPLGKQPKLQDYYDYAPSNGFSIEDYILDRYGVGGDRQRRSLASSNHHATAEDMMGNDELEDLKGNRVKRDLRLGQDELQALLNSADNSLLDYDYPMVDRRADIPPMDLQEAEGTNDEGAGLTENEVEEILNEEMENYAQQHPNAAPVVAEPERQEDPELEEIRERFALLNYVYGNGEDPERLAEEEERTEAIAAEERAADLAEARQEALEEAVREEEQEEEEEMRERMAEREEALIEETEDEGPEVEYKHIIYEGEPGIFIPSKRQYMSMVPGMRKRTFFPYSYGADARYAGLVPQEDKRAESAMSDRLYRLAMALRGNEDMDDFRK